MYSIVFEMSNESSASETTPLRRPDSQISEDNSNGAGFNNVAKNVSISDNDIVSSNRIGGIANGSNSKSGTGSGGIATTPTIATINSTILNSNSNSASTNRNIEVRLAHLTPHHNNNNNYNNNNNSAFAGELIKMETNKRILLRVGIDGLILLCVGFPILCFHLWGTSYKRGFFCDDESLKHPFHESTVRNWMLYIIGLVIPVGVIFIVEVVSSREIARRSNGNHNTRKYVFMNYDIPDWLVECYKKIGIFGFGAAVSQLTTDIAKYSIGRLRPHFFTVCQPQMNDGTTCADPINAGKYIQDFTCASPTSSARMLKEVRLSFPSGHSSFTFYTMVYVALYLQARMTWHGSKLFRHFLQFLFIMIAWYTALSRVSDYKHHWSDVLAGSTIGAFIAIIVAKYISDLFVERPMKSYLPSTTQDVTTPPQTITTN